MRRSIVVGVAALWMLLYGVRPVSASFHTFGVNEVYSNASGTIQYIELHERLGADFEGFFNGVTLTSNGNTFTFPSDLPNQSTANKFVLLGTAGYAAIPGAPAADFPIPSNFFNPAGDSLNYGFGSDLISFSAVPANSRQSFNRSGSSMVVGNGTPTNFAGQSGAVPEPATCSLLALTAAILLGRRRDR
ncbi:MAG: calcium-binding protein [Phycisphaerales bacterium]|nr:calcium-binding protein [Phycisphaerales bacterium]